MVRRLRTPLSRATVPLARGTTFRDAGVYHRIRATLLVATRQPPEGTPAAQHVSGQEWTGVDTLPTDRENMRNQARGESDSVPYKEKANAFCAGVWVGAHVDPLIVECGCG